MSLGMSITVVFASEGSDLDILIFLGIAAGLQIDGSCLVIPVKLLMIFSFPSR
jgi:hypothetical protein